MAIEGLRIIKELREKYGSDLGTIIQLNNLEKEIKHYEDILGDYEELKSDYDSLVGVSSTLAYYRDLCSRLEKKIEDLENEKTNL